MKDRLKNSNMHLRYRFIMLLALSGLVVIFLPSMANSVKSTDNGATTTTLITQRVLPLGIAQQLANATQAQCSDNG